MNTRYLIVMLNGFDQSKAMELDSWSHHDARCPQKCYFRTQMDKPSFKKVLLSVGVHVTLSDIESYKVYR